MKRKSRPTRSRRQLSSRRRPHLERLELRQLLSADGLSLVADSVEIEQNSAAIRIDVLENDSFDDDYAGNREITAVSTGSLGGRIEIDDQGGSLLYMPPADSSGQEVFRYTVDGTASVEVAVRIVSPLGTFVETIHLFREEYQLDLLANARFAEDYTGNKRITLISETAHGADLRIADDGQSVLYRSRIGVEGEDRFTYIVDDHYVATATVKVVNPLESDRYEVLQNSGQTSLDVLSNDFLSGADDGVNLSQIRASAQITHVLSDSDKFQVEIADDGRSINFTPGEDFAGYYVPFRYVVDGQFEQTVRVTVHRPVRDDFHSADTDGGTHTLDLLGNDSYRSIFGSQVIRVVQRVTSVTQGDQGGTVEIIGDGTQVLYTPAAGFIGTEQFDYVADEKYQASVTVSVTQPVRDDWQVVHEGTNTPIDVLANDFAADQGVDATITSIGESQIGASITLSPSGMIIYSPPSGVLSREPRVYSDQFEYTVNDQYTSNVQISLASITAGDFNQVDRPVERLLRVLENDHFGAHYPGPGQITAVSPPSDGGTVSISADGFSVLYRPGSVQETFTYTVDDRFTETVHISGIPRLRSDRAVADQNGAAVIIDVLANDFHESDYILREYGPYLGNRRLTSVTQSEQGGAVSITESGNVRYEPPADYVGKDSFSYTIDEFLTQQVRVDVIRRAADDLIRVAPDSKENSLNVLANDILGADYSGPGLISELTTTRAGADVSIGEGGRSITYAPPAGFQGEDSFTYTVDGRSKATVTVSVHDEASGLLSQFESADELRDYLLERSIERYQSQFGQPIYRYDYFNRDVTVFASAAGTEGIEFSETNVQVAGVDEADIVETDGNFIYSLRGDELAIVNSFRADELELVSRTQIEGAPIGMYLRGDRITVISRLVEYESFPVPTEDTAGDALIAADSTFAGDLIYPWPVPAKVTTVVTVLDILDRLAPQIVQRTTVDGDFTDSRRIGDQVFLVLGSRELLLEPELICGAESTNCVYESEEDFTDRVLGNFASLIQEKLPNYESYNGDAELIRGGPLVLPEDIFRSLDGASSMTIVVSINMASHEPGLAATSAVLASPGSNIYATAESLYVFNSHHEAIENELWTRILKFDWDGFSGAVRLAAIGDVPGTLLDQFSADEDNGLLRVTTEVSNIETGNYSRQNETALFVLEDDRGVLEFIGRMQNLALGQSVKSVRYFGDTAMVTTFPTQGQPVDPLYAIDLSDAANPRVLGHVAIPGFNSYMQFIAPDRLLTVGTNTATGWGGRAMVSLFDVSDLTSPRLIDQYNLPKYSTSQANLDHHAFGWFARHELLAVPISRYFQDRFDDDGDGYPEAIRSVREDALSMLRVGVDDATGEEGISLGGEIDHAASVLRSVYINNNIYSVGLDAIRTVSVDDPAVLVDEVVFPGDSELPTPFGERSRFDVVQLATAARQKLAGELNVNIGNVFVVTQEASGGTYDVVLRSDAGHYRYQGASGDELTLVEQGFEFVDQWHNESNPNDVNGDEKVTASDALGVINELRRRAGSDLPVDRVLRQIDAAVRFADTNGDGYVTAVDALRVVNQMARDLEQRLAESEEQRNQIAAAVRPSSVDIDVRSQNRDEPRLLF